MANFFGAGEKTKSSNFLGLFFVKGELVEAKTFPKVSSCDSEGPQKAWGKTDSRFPIQHRKKLGNFYRGCEKIEISNIIGQLFLKDKVVEPEILTGVSCPDTEGLWKVLGKNKSCCPI